jgi:hypothetical protein
MRPRRRIPTYLTTGPALLLCVLAASLIASPAARAQSLDATSLVNALGYSVNSSSTGADELGLTALASPTPATDARAAPRTWRSGVFSGTPNADIRFGTWRGSPVQLGTDYLAQDSWAVIENPTTAITSWQKQPSITPVLSVPLWPQNSGDSLALAATGADNAHWAALGRNLVAGGLAGAIIRPGWEFNGTWYPWSVATPADAANFAAAWRQIVGTLQATPGQHFGFDWCPTHSAGGIDPALAYPGDAYVTTVGMDVYDFNFRTSPTPEQRWDDIVNVPYGLRWQAAFAAAHGKPVSFAEWGLVNVATTPSAGGNDDPAFVQHMYDWFSSHRTAFENYFNSDTTTGTFYGIYTIANQFPNAAALYRKLW